MTTTWTPAIVLLSPADLELARKVATPAESAILDRMIASGQIVVNDPPDPVADLVAPWPPRRDA